MSATRTRDLLGADPGAGAGNRGAGPPRNARGASGRYQGARASDAARTPTGGAGSGIPDHKLHDDLGVAP